MADDFADYVLEQMSGLEGLRSRKMFDGWGEVPTEILEDKDKLAEWVRAAAKLSTKNSEFCLGFP